LEAYRRVAKRTLRALDRGCAASDGPGRADEDLSASRASLATGGADLAPVALPLSPIGEAVGEPIPYIPDEAVVLEGRHLGAELI